MKNSPHLDINFKSLKKIPFASFSNFLSLSPHQWQKAKLENKVDFFIKNKDHTSLIHYLENGYVLTQKQEINLIRFLDKEYGDGDKAFLRSFFNKLLSYEQIPPRFYQLVYLNTSLPLFIQHCEEKNYTYVPQETAKIQKYPVELIDKIYFCITALEHKALFIETWASNIFHHYNRINSSYLSKEASIALPFYRFKEHLLKNATEKQLKEVLTFFSHPYLDSSLEIKAITNSIKSQIKKIQEQSEDFKSERDIEIERIQKIYHKSNTEKAKQQYIIPESSQQLVSRIEAMHARIMNNSSNLTTEEKNNMERFLNERIPDFINTYNAIYDKDKIDDKTHKTPLELLNDSLRNILSNLETHIKTLDESNMKKLRVNLNYTESYMNDDPQKPNKSI